MRKLFKAELIILLMASLFLGLLTACGTDDSPDGSNKPAQNKHQTQFTINLNDYVNVEFRGRDGQGTVKTSILPSDLIQVLHQFTIGLYDDTTLKSTLTGSDNHDLDIFVANTEQEKNLRNGDTIQFTWTVNERGLRLLKEQVPGVEFIWSDFEYTVCGLEGVVELDPFTCEARDAHIDCEYKDSYYSGEAIITAWKLDIRRRSNGSSGSVDIEVDTMGHEGPWKNGDQVKITILADDAYILEEFGVILTNKSAIVTIDWLKEN